jgi:chromosome segregation ATPase
MNAKYPQFGTPTPTTARSKQVEELKATITAQDNTISTLQAQFGSLRSSHEAHIASLTEAHAKEVATLRTYSRVLEEQQSQRTLHHGELHAHAHSLSPKLTPLSP